MAVIHIFLKDFGDLYCVSIYALRYQQDNKNEVHLHQDILERRLLPGSEASGETADYGDRCQLGFSLATLQTGREQCAARLFVCRI